MQRPHAIDRAEVFVVGPDVERYTWAEGMSDQYMVNIILRLTATSGLQGIAGAAMITPHGFDRSVGEALRCLLPDVIGRIAGRARGAVVPAAQSRHADGAAGPFADRHRALGHGGAACRPCRSISCSAAPATRSCPMPRRRCSPTTRPMSTTSRRARRGGLQGRSSSIAGACRSATCRCARRSIGSLPGAAWR